MASLPVPIWRRGLSVLRVAKEESWLGNFGHWDKWVFCLTVAMLPRIRSEHDEAAEVD
jgi:hypothetical protein